MAHTRSLQNLSRSKILIGLLLVWLLWAPTRPIRNVAGVILHTVADLIAS